MNVTVAVEPDPEFPAGHAVVRLRGAAAFAGPFGFRIRRDDFDDSVFGPSGWQIADAVLTPDARSIDGDDLLLHVGPSVAQHIVSGVYHFALPAANFETPVVWPDLPLLSDAALNIVAEPARAAPRAAAAPRPQIQRRAPDGQSQPAELELRTVRAGLSGAPGEAEDPADETVRLPPRSAPAKPEPTEAVVVPARPAPWARWALLALLMAVVAGGGYLAYRYAHLPAPVVAQRQPPEPASPTSQTSPEPPHPPPASTPAPGPAAPTDIEHMTGIELARSGAAPEVLLREAERRMQLGGDHRNDALLLMQVAADRNYAPAHAALGRFYDPDLPHPPDIQSDEHQAALQYHAAAQGGDNSVAEARAALKAYLEQRAGLGDVFAPQILRDFWP